MNTCIDDAIGALKLVPLHFSHPSMISRATVIGAACEALARLESMPARSNELLEAFRKVRQVLREGDTAYVTPTTCPERPYGAVVVDASGRLVATATGKTVEGLAELIRLRLPAKSEACPPEGRGETGGPQA
ncbi:hypothetical protein [Stutzerimonas nitrititolerans]|uniref:hypothetical protein n=1 Tax=Stutzerimonas nitrititolerans TaxID=2482751 RepID=UPI00289B34D1|nr:hypothetical protein [Stutzerimonas nitrititolerans]